MQQIQLSPLSYIVLGLIDVAGEATPYELKRMATTTVGGFWSVAHSQIYAEPDRLAKAGLLSERREEEGRRRKRYAITASGRRALREWIAAPEAGGYELRDAGLLKLAFGADPAPMAKTQLEFHRAKLEELEALATTLEVSGAAEGPRLVAEAGIGHEKEYIRFWSRLAERRSRPRSRGQKPSARASR